MVIPSWCFNYFKNQLNRKKDYKEYYWRFGYAESLQRNGAKTAEWWSEGVPHAGVSEHHQVSPNWTRLAF